MSNHMVVILDKIEINSSLYISWSGAVGILLNIQSEPITA
jgi:hypothetical protein